MKEALAFKDRAAPPRASLPQHVGQRRSWRRQSPESASAQLASVPHLKLASPSAMAATKLGLAS